ncbi:MAG TPA: glycosyltransferase [Micropepsaceae bacterium]|nr:glycosyltransferase [Micropepsaceae bacterium]
MQIVIVSDFGAVNGGAAKVAVSSARGLADAGVPVTYVCAVAPISPLLDHPRIAVRCLDFGNVWGRGNPLAAAAQGIWFRRARTALEEILAPLTAGETIVHFHQWTKALSPSVLAAPAAHGLPSVVSLHDYFFVCPNGAYYRYAEAKPCNVAPMSASCIGTQCDRHSVVHKAVRTLRQSATSRAASQAGSSLSVLNMSPFAARVMDRFIPQEHGRYVVRSPVEIDRGPPVPVADNDSFLFVGRLTEEKGVRLLAEVARDAGLPLTIAGDGPLLSELKQFGGKVNCTGWLDGAALSNTMRRARALVFPSTWYETGGLVVLEALAQGIPVIVSRNTGAAEFIEDGANGYLIDPGDAAGMRAAMLNLTDNARASRMGAEAYRRYWAAPQTIQVHTEKLLSVYRAILTEHRLRTAPVGHA